jgi:hypothetical protein
MLKYSLIENQLTERLDDYTAQTQSVSSLDKDALITRILDSGTTLTPPDLLAAINAYENIIAKALLEGNTINTPLFNTSFSMSGIFDGPADIFDGNRHKLNINLSKGTMLREVEKNVKFEKTEGHAPQPNIQAVKDSYSGVMNEKLTSGGVVELLGYNLKIAGDHADCGLWFIAEDGTAFKSQHLIENKPARVIGSIPSLTVGKWQVKVITQFGGSRGFVKIPRQSVYQRELIVE